ncbi:hypothetical protein M8J76_005025, partial [Diaphorina citri]
DLHLNSQVAFRPNIVRGTSAVKIVSALQSNQRLSNQFEKPHQDIVWAFYHDLVIYAAPRPKPGVNPLH